MVIHNIKHAKCGGGRCHLKRHCNYSEYFFNTNNQKHLFDYLVLYDEMR